MHKIDTKSLNIRTDLVIEQDTFTPTTKETINNVNITLV